jgi:hypothetical protein
MPAPPSCLAARISCDVCPSQPSEIAALDESTR